MTQLEWERWRWFPPPGLEDGGADRALRETGDLEIDCPVCGTHGPVDAFTDNPRESGRCLRCGAWNRIRQVGLVLAHAASEVPVGTVAELADLAGLVVYNTESRGPLHEALARAPGYVCSEYFGPEHRSGGAGPGGVLHEDLQALSFPAGCFDLVVSTDVFEHVPDPYAAHAEVHRVLRPGGHHVFTVPYDERSALDGVRARIGSDGEIEHLAEPQYHGDPLRPDGVLVFTIFGLQMVVELARLGFATTVYRLWSPRHGIVGPGGLVFDAQRASDDMPRPARTPDLSVVVHSGPVEAMLATISSMADLDPDLETELVVLEHDAPREALRLLAALEGNVRVVRARRPRALPGWLEDVFAVGGGPTIAMCPAGAPVAEAFRWPRARLPELAEPPGGGWDAAVRWWARQHGG